jgi:uncharacterized protein YqhQ
VKAHEAEQGGKQMSGTFHLVGQADHLLESSWRERKWGTFIRVWLTTTVGLMVLAFVLPFVFIYLPAFLYNIIPRVFGGKILNVLIFDMWTLGAGLAIMVGLFTLILTMPVMMLKQISGDLRH